MDQRRFERVVSTGWRWQFGGSRTAGLLEVTSSTFDRGSGLWSAHRRKGDASWLRAKRLLASIWERRTASSR